jgi:cobinamide kinase/cobinamide phosphate guanyltransferase
MQEAHPNKVTFVLGGLRSGKSRFAQRIASATGSVVFIATAKPSDPEMELRIERHRKTRPATWQTLEVPVDLDVAIASGQALGMDKGESTNTMQCERFCQHGVELCEKLARRRGKPVVGSLTDHRKGVPASCLSANSSARRLRCDSPLSIFSHSPCGADDRRHLPLPAGFRRASLPAVSIL